MVICFSLVTLLTRSPDRPLRIVHSVKPRAFEIGYYVSSCFYFLLLIVYLDSSSHWSHTRRSHLNNLTVS